MESLKFFETSLEARLYSRSQLYLGRGSDGNLVRPTEVETQIAKRWASAPFGTNYLSRNQTYYDSRVSLRTEH